MLQFFGKVKDLLSRLRKTPENFTGRIIFMCRCSTTFPVDHQTMKKNVWQMPNSYLCVQGSLVLNNDHSLVQLS